MRRSPLSHPVRPSLKPRLVGVLLLLSLTGCHQYEFTFNEQPIEGVPKLAERIDMADPELADCVDQTVYDQRITQLTQLTRLSCQQNGIRSLDGINQLRQLSYVNLARNHLQSAAPLLSLPNLAEVDLRGNSGLECGSVRQLAERGVRVRSPGHCR